MCSIFPAPAPCGVFGQRQPRRPHSCGHDGVGIGRRATAGPAEQTFATLVGLELRPRKLREAGVLWERLTQAAGVDARDAVWQHPDLLPGSEDLDEPAAFIDRVIGGETSGIDEAIAEFERGADPDGGAGSVDS